MTVRLFAVAALILISGVAVAGPDAPADAVTKVELSYEMHRTWPFVLPTPTWTVISDDNPLTLPGSEPYKTEKDGKSLKIDTDGDGTFDVTARGKDAMVRLQIPAKAAGATAVVRALRLVNQGAWRFAAGGSWSGMVGDTKLHLIDQNNDGDVLDIGEDAIVIGESKHAQFLSRVLALPNGLYRMTVAGSPPAMELHPYTGPTGTLNLVSGFETKGRLLSAVVRSQNESLSFDVAAAPEGLVVPTGTYEFVAGEVGRGESRVRVEGGQMNALVVAADKPTTLSWGGPLTATFSWVRQADKVVFAPNLVTYAGTAGEQYTGWAPPGPSPEFIVTTAEKKGAEKKGEEIGRIRFGGS